MPHLVFGGSFDPPHRGHVEAFASAQARFPGARGLIVPSRQAATAAGFDLAGKRERASFDERLELCRIAFADAPDTAVSALEADLPLPNRTIRTLERLRGEWPQERLALVIGLDQFAAFGGWSQPGAILQMADLVIVPRVGMNLPTWRECLQRLEQAVGQRIHQSGGDEWRLGEGGSRLLRARPIHCPAQSRELRRRLEAGGPLPEDWLIEPHGRWRQRLGEIYGGKKG